MIPFGSKVGCCSVPDNKELSQLEISDIQRLTKDDHYYRMQIQQYQLIYKVLSNRSTFY